MPTAYFDTSALVKIQACVLIQAHPLRAYDAINLGGFGDEPKSLRIADLKGKRFNPLCHGLAGGAT